MINDQFVVNPTTEQMKKSELDLMMAVTDTAILMIEVCSQALFAHAEEVEEKHTLLYSRIFPPQKCKSLHVIISSTNIYS
jgi:polyribonucleotide nucleotidyltransferase